MLPSYKPLPPIFQCLQAGVSLAAKAGWSLTDLSFDSMHESAMRATGLDDFGDPYYQIGLNVLLDSVRQDAGMHTYGRFIFRIMLVNYLVQRLRFIEAKKQRPSVFQTSLNSPCFITGLPRSGTTFLHRLLSAQKRHHGISYWQLFRPFPASRQLDFRRLLAWAELNILRPLYPRMDVKHRLRANIPEEDLWMMGITFFSPVFWILAPVTGYIHWFCQSDRCRAYGEYAQLLRWLQAANPDKRLIMKAPDHMRDLDLLLAAVPNARILQINRNPTTCVLSLSSLLYSAHALFTENLRPARIYKINHDLVVSYLDGNQRAKDDPAVRQVVIDLDYDALINHPVETLAAYFELEAFVFPPQRLDHHHHRYSLAQFGLQEDI